MAFRIQLRKGLASAWTNTNPVLLSGEPGYESDTGKLKIGDGFSRWNVLPYFGGGGGISSIQIEYQGTPIGSTGYTTLNFVGTGVTIAGGTGPTATITITGGVGSTGPTGPQGQIGLQGPTGGKGATGSQGPTGSGAIYFTDLLDVPKSYTGASGYLVSVNSGGTGLTFIPSVSSLAIYGPTGTKYTSGATGLGFTGSGIQSIVAH